MKTQCDFCGRKCGDKLCDICCKILKDDANARAFKETMQKAAKAISEEMNDNRNVRTEFCQEGERFYIKEVK